MDPKENDLSLFEVLTRQRDDSPALIDKMVEAVDRLERASKETTPDRPGMLLGKIQSGKTRAFIGIMARAFDEGYDFAIVLTKGTQALSEQTMKRLSRDFASAIDDDKLRGLAHTHVIAASLYIDRSRLCCSCRDDFRYPFVIKIDDIE